MRVSTPAQSGMTAFGLFGDIKLRDPLWICPNRRQPFLYRIGEELPVILELSGGCPGLSQTSRSRHIHAEGFCGSAYFSPKIAGCGDSTRFGSYFALAATKRGHTSGP